MDAWAHRFAVTSQNTFISRSSQTSFEQGCLHCTKRTHGICRPVLLNQRTCVVSCFSNSRTTAGGFHGYPFAAFNKSCPMSKEKRGTATAGLTALSGPGRCIARAPACAVLAEAILKSRYLRKFVTLVPPTSGASGHSTQKTPETGGAFYVLKHVPMNLGKWQRESEIL